MLFFVLVDVCLEELCVLAPRPFCPCRASHTRAHTLADHRTITQVFLITGEQIYFCTLALLFPS